MLRPSVIFHGETTNGGVYRRFIRTSGLLFHFLSIFVHFLYTPAKNMRAYILTPSGDVPRDAKETYACQLRGPRLDNARVHRYRASIIG